MALWKNRMQFSCPAIELPDTFRYFHRIFFTVPDWKLSERHNHWPLPIWLCRGLELLIINNKKLSAVEILFFNQISQGLRLFGAAVSALRRFGVETFRRWDDSAPRRFGAETIRRRDHSALRRFGAETIRRWPIRRGRFGAGRSQMFLVQNEKKLVFFLT